MQPNIVIYWPAIIVAFACAFVFGGIWYGPLFGKKWARLVGMDCEKKPDSKLIQRAMMLQAFGLFLTTWVLVHSGQVWRPSVWGIGADQPDYVYGLFNAFFTWIGFFIPLQLGKIAWENRPWKLFFINAGHDFLTLLIISMILTYWR